MMAADNPQSPSAEDPRGQGDWRPRPDPTVLTTQALREAEQSLISIMSERIASLRELIAQRLDGMDRATELLAEQVTKIPEASDLRFMNQRTDILAQVDALRKLLEQRLDGMDEATRLLAAQVTKIPVDADAARERVRAEATQEVMSLRELLEQRLAGMDIATKLLAGTVDQVPTETDKAVGNLRELLGARIDGMDTATKLLASSVEKFPSDIDRSAVNTREYLLSLIKQVESVSVEKFSAIEGTFASNALALTAALAAQKEAAAEQNKSNTLAIAKSEQATKETISSNATQTANSLASQAANIADLKDRVVRIESGGVATTAAHTEQRLNINQIVAVLAIVATIAAALLLAFKK